MHSINEKINSVENDKWLFLASFDLKFMLLVIMTKACFILIATWIIYRFKGSRFLKWPKSLFGTASFVFRLTFVNDIGVKGPSLIAVVFFGLFLFNFLAQQIISNNIKTSKVVTDTDSLITDKRSLFKSPRKIAWLGSERDRFIARNSPKNTFLHDLYHLKNEQPVRVVQTQVDANLISALNSNLFFLGGLLSSVALNYIAPFSPSKFYLHQDPLFSSYNVFYRKKESSPKMDYIDAYVTKIFESGIAQLVRKRLKTTKLSGDKDFVLENKVYRSLESYISQNTFFEPINFYNFFYIFAAFLTMCISVALLLVAVRFSAQLKVWFLVILEAIRSLSGTRFKVARKKARRVKRRRPFIAESQ